MGGAPLGGGPAVAPAAMAAAGAVPAAADPFDLLGSATGPALSPAAADLPVILTAEKGKGVVVRGRLVRSGGKTAYVLNVNNGSAGVVDGFMVQVRLPKSFVCKLAMRRSAITQPSYYSSSF